MSIDRRFGKWNKFGTTNTFGASSVNASLAWGVEVDWDGDYIFDGSNEAKYMVGIRGQRGRPRYVTRNGQGFEKVNTGRFYITLDNSTGRYDAWNTSSPLYPNVTYGRDVNIKVRSFATDTVYNVFRGLIEDIQPSNTLDGEKRVIITVVDGWQYLRNYTARYAIQQNITPDEAIGFILDSVSWPSRWGRNLDAVLDNIRYWWANGNKIAANEIDDVAESFLGYFFIDNTGRASYKSRSNVGTSFADLTSSVLLKDVTLPQPWDYSRNLTRIKVHPRTAAATGVIYQLVGNTPSVVPGAANALTLFGNYTYNNVAVPATNIVTPVATTDYTMNTASDGSGSNQTANCTVTITDFGDSVKFIITNNSGVTVYITKLQLRGDALYEPNVSDVIYQGTGFSSLPREFKLDLLWQQDINVATDFSNIIGPYLDQLHPFPYVQLEGRPDEQFAPDLFDVVTLTLTNLGILGDSYRVAYIEHESVTENCQSIRTKFHLESYISANEYWIWGTAQFDSTTIFGA